MIPQDGLCTNRYGLTTHSHQVQPQGTWMIQPHLLLFSFACFVPLCGDMEGMTLPQAEANFWGNNQNTSLRFNPIKD